MRRWLRQWKTWIGIAVSALALLWVVRGIDWSVTGEAIARASPLPLAAVFVLTPLIYVGMRSIRWRILLHPHRPPLRRLAEATAIGLMANNVLPARLGEFVRAYALGRSEGMATSTAFGSLMVERVYDGLSLVLILALLALAMPFPAWVETTAWIGLAVFAAALLVMLVAVSSTERVHRFVERWSRRRPEPGLVSRLIAALVALLEGFRTVRSPWIFLLSMFLALVQWALVAITFRLGLAAFDLAAPTGWTGALFLESIAGLGVAVPSSPGFVGTFHAIVVKGLEVFDVERSRAFSFAVAFHAANYLSVTLAGLYFFYRTRFTWSELERSEEVVEHRLEGEDRRVSR